MNISSNQSNVKKYIKLRYNEVYWGNKKVANDIDIVIKQRQKY